MRITKKRRERALELIRSGEQIIDVADAIGVTRQALYWLKLNDEDFGKEWLEAKEIGDEIQLGECEKEMDFRGRIGWIEPQFYEGRICGYRQKFSDGLLMARAKALAPDKYGDRAKHERSGTIGVSGAVVVPGKMTPDSWEQAANAFDDLGPPPMDQNPDEAAQAADE